MAVVDVRAFMRATPDRIWQKIADIEGQQHWMVDVRSLKIISLPLGQSGKPELGSGAVIELRTVLFGLPVLRDIIEVTTWDPPREMGVLHKGQFSGTGVWRLEPVRGGTVFVWREEYEPPLGALGELAHAVFVRSHLTRMWARSLDKLRQLVEASD